MAQDLVIVSWNDNGFWQADEYLQAAQYDGNEMERMGLAPDCFVTFPRDVSREDAISRAAAWRPQADLRVAEDDENEESE